MGLIHAACLYHDLYPIRFMDILFAFDSVAELQYYQSNEPTYFLFPLRKVDINFGEGFITPVMKSYFLL